MQRPATDFDTFNRAHIRARLRALADARRAELRAERSGHPA